MNELAEQALQLLDEQTRSWEFLRINRAAADEAAMRDFDFGHFSVRAMFNPKRMKSTLAQTADTSTKSRPCILCDANRPPEQTALDCGWGFKLMCNPFPVLPRHFTVVHEQHRPQRIADGIEGLLEVSRALGGEFVVFYNGPECGASVPDHLHLQAAARGSMPLENECPPSEQTVAAVEGFLRRFIVIRSDNLGEMQSNFSKVYRSFQSIQPQRIEPMMNLICSHDQDGWRLMIFPRRGHRPAIFLEPEHAQLLLSPGTTEMGGLITLPIERDFQRLARQHIEQMYEQTTLSADLFQRLLM